MASLANPLLPVGYDIAWSVIAALGVALLVVALVSLARAAKHLTPTQSLLWTLIALVIPVVGPLAWLFVGRPSAAARRVSTNDTPVGG